MQQGLTQPQESQITLPLASTFLNTASDDDDSDSWVLVWITFEIIKLLT